MLTAATIGNMTRNLLLFPIQSNAKFPPLIVGWQIAATDSGDQIRTWKTVFNNPNFGVHCKDLLVLDVDVRKGGEIPPGLPQTYTVGTPSGGYHLYFHCPGGVPNSVGKIAAGVDVRSNGGYVLAEGSVVDGNSYRCEVDAPIANAPEWVIEKCKAAKVTPVTEVENTNWNVDRALREAADWLAGQEPAVEGAGGDARTYAVCCHLRDVGVPRDRMQEVLEPWNTQCSPPWEPDELQRKIDNAFNYAQNAPGSKNVQAMFTPVEDSTAPAPAEKPAIEYLRPYDIDLRSVLATNYLVKGWLDRKVQAQAFGPWGAGKTFCILDMGAHIAAGESWFGQRVRQGGVLYCGYEGGDGLPKRLYALRHAYPDWPWQDIPFLAYRLGYALVDRNAGGQKLRGQADFEAAIKGFPGGYPALIIIDPMRNALGGSDSDADLTAAFMTYTSAITKATGATILTVHHPGHGDASRGRGDSAVDAWLDTVIQIDGEKIFTRKQRDDIKNVLHYRLKPVDLGEDSDGDMVSTCVVEQIGNNPADPRLTGPQQEFYENLKALAQDGVIKKRDFTAAAPGKPVAERTAIVQALLTKYYLIPDGAGYRVGNGAVEMFM